MIVVGTSDWRGAFRDGEGTVSTATTDTLPNAPYTYASRFDGAPGAIPEELLAAGHAGCFNHAVANISGQKGLTVESVHTSVEVTMGTDDHGPAITGVHITTDATIPGATEDTFRQIAEGARAWCAFSKALSVEITLKATLSN
ncbi:OsmC family peroxiredoxin [Actinacidiphila rubida]|uniref:Osmotically inducible protein OsmC n=1 Tax=Actinacidiphila rubida TaxID=310780 RepID=A0A1H8PXS1_9ACTN|nr:OsmC family peroxiredoxin [Actinacidiphila rubida]SEO46548.1 osmotically inducible protein OsmC [Actinacidiphila rubida]